MKKFIQLLKTEFRRIFSNSTLVSVFFFSPIIFGVLFANVYKKGKVTELPIVVIDEDRTPLSGKIIDALNENETLWISDVRYDAGGIAKEMASKEYVAVITIPVDFESNILQKRYPEILADINTANLVTANFASGAVQKVLGSISAVTEIEALKKSGNTTVAATERFEPFKVNYNRFYNPSGNYMELMLPGVLGTIMQQVLFLALALVFARDFEDNYFSKLVVASRLPLYHIVLKMVPFIMLSTITWLIVGSYYFIFNIDIPVFTWPMVLLVSVFTLSCIFIGMLFSVALKSQIKATQFLMVLATPSFILSGFTWPKEAMPKAIQHLADIIPLTHFLQGFRRLAIYRGTIQDIIPQLKSLSLIGIICFIGITAILQLKISRQIKNSKVIG